MKSEEALEQLWRTAWRLGRAGGRGKRRSGIPPLFFVTDPARTPNPAQVAERLPRGAGLIYRPFGDPAAVAVGRGLAAIARRRGLVLLVGADEHLAYWIGARGVHLPERLMHQAPDLRRRRPGWLITAAAHGPRGLAAADRLGIHAVLLSPVFASASPSAGAPLGLQRFSRLVRGASIAVYALGGVKAHNAPSLLGSGAAGLAAVDSLYERGSRLEHP